ncbi:hypothetical protein D3C72_1562890 [compost metagenome]
MADGDGCVRLQEQQGHRLADRVAAADDDGVLAAQVHARAFDQLHAAVWRARAEAGQARHQFACAQDRIAVHVFRRGDRFDDLVRVDMFWQRHLHEDAMDGRIGIQAGDACQQVRFGQVRFIFFQHRVETHVSARLDLVADVHLAGRVFADEDHGQAGLGALGREGGGARGDLAAQFLGEGDSVDQLCWHGRRLCGREKTDYKAGRCKGAVLAMQRRDNSGPETQA